MGDSSNPTILHHHETCGHCCYCQDMISVLNVKEGGGWVSASNMEAWRWREQGQQPEELTCVEYIPYAL